MLRKCYGQGSSRAGACARRPGLRALPLVYTRVGELGSCELGSCVYARKDELHKEVCIMKYRVTFKGWDCEENYVEVSWEYTSRSEAAKKHAELCDFAEWGDKVYFEEIRD